ncbi:ferric reductase like transmembrane component-domain-containing protein [Ilyonectria destructans]|nr:ferric reductase like transmembrane component-domain-containing protein [Ilyonectria destructans]
MKEPLRAAAIFLFLAVSGGLVFGLTYLPCYATLCPEDYFPLETRLHLGAFYGLLAMTTCMLLLRASSESVRSLSGLHISPKLPIFGKRITFGGLTISISIILATLATAGFWLPAQLDFWGERTDPLDWTYAKITLTITGVTGHYADILLGLLIIPVSRNSLMGRVFELHHSTLLYAHKLVAYLFLLAGLAHGGAYAAYALDPSSEGSHEKEEAFTTGNPAMTLAESEKRSTWYTYTTYTGAAAIVFMIIITLTALPYIRRRFYNVFYYCHIVTSICIFAAASIHASTDFYLLLPGLFLWIVDWGLRLFGGDAQGLHSSLVATGEDAGNGWYRISLPTMSKTASDEHSDLAAIETAVPLGSPLAYYYLIVPTISRLQNHAFTAAIPGSAGSGPVFLFQRAQRKNGKALEKEWTWKLAAKLSGFGRETGLKVRVEGPYQPRDIRFKTASHIICVVGGTGITGACSLAFWWLKARSMDTNTMFTLIWTVRNRDMVNIKEWHELGDIARSTSNLKIMAHISSEDGRLNPSVHIRQHLGLTEKAAGLSGTEVGQGAGNSAWVYSSGPDSLIQATETACVEARREMKALAKTVGNEPAQTQKLDWYMAKWEV